MASDANTPGDHACESRFDSLNCDDVVIDKPGDKTIKPISEEHRRSLEKRGLIPRRQPEPPPTPPENKE